nr:hypothetical protein [Tanacetum cinerariifolium]
MKKIIKEQVKSQVKAQRSDEQRNLYKALVEAYDADKTILDTYGELAIRKRRHEDDDQEGPFAGLDWGSKRQREGGEHASAITPSEPATRSAGKSTIGTQSRQLSASKSAFAEEPVQTTCQMEEPSHPVFETDTPIDFSNFIMNRLGLDTLTPELLAGPTYELMRGSCNSLTELEYHLEEVNNATTDQLDWDNPEGQQYPHNLLQPLPLIPNNRGRRVIPFKHFINNDLEYLRGGALSQKYTTSVTKRKAADYGHIKWIEDLVPRTMWIQEPLNYDKHALWGFSHWGQKRQQFYGFAINRESTLDVYSKRRIIAVTDLKIVEWHNYKHLDWISGGDEVSKSKGESDKEETRKEEEESFDLIPRTPEESEDESNDEEDQELRLCEETRIQEEEDVDELYRDVNINQGRGLQALVEAYDADKAILDTYGESTILKRRREDDDQEGPSTGSDRGSKRQKEGDVDDQTKGSDDKKGKKTDESNDDDDDDHDEAKKVNDEDRVSEEEETTENEEESFDPIPRTPEDGEDDGNGEEDQGLKISEEEKMHEEEEADEIYRNSSSISSFVTSLLNPIIDLGMESIFTIGLSTVTPIPLPKSTMTPSIITTTTTASQPPIPPTPIPSDIFLTLLTFASVFLFEDKTDRLQESIQRENDEFLRTIDDNMKKIIKEQVKSQVKAQVTRILPRIEESVNAQLEAEVLTRLSHSLRTLYDALVEAYDADTTILDTYGESAILKRRREEDDDQEGPSAGSDRASKRRREGGEHASASTPSEPATGSAGRSTTGTQSRQLSASEFAFAVESVQTTCQMEEHLHPPRRPPTPDRDWNKTLPAAQGNAQLSNFIMNRLGVDTLTPELLAGPTYELMRGSCNSLTELEYHLEEVYKATANQLDWNNPEGQQYPHNLLQPLPLIPDNRGRCRNLYKALVEAYESDKIILDIYGDTVMLKRRRNDDADKDEEPSVGSNQGSNRRREGKEPELASTPKEKATRSTRKSTQGSKSRQTSTSESTIAEEPMQTTFEMEEPSIQSHHVIPFDHFLNNDLEYLRGGASSHKYTTYVTKIEASDYGHIKWIKDLVPRTMLIQEPVGYDKHALWGISHWGHKRQEFYGFAVNRESARVVYSKRRIIAITKLKIVEWHNYKHMYWITVQEAQLTKPNTYRSDLKRKEAYIAYSNPRGFIYQNKDKQNRLMRIDELHKFNDGMLTDVRTALDDRLKGIRMKYLP